MKKINHIPIKRLRLVWAVFLILSFQAKGFSQEPLDPKSGSKADTLTKPQKIISPLLTKEVKLGTITKTKEHASTSLHTVEGSKLINQPQSSIEQLLQGQLPGLNVYDWNGAPGDFYRMEIRGRNTFGLNSMPLIIVDGIPVLAEDLGTSLDPTMLSEGPGMSFLSKFSPDEIESVTILKDAASLALYGARGANGVLIIETKKFKKCLPQVDLNAYYGTGMTAYTPHFVMGEKERGLKMELYDRFASDEQWRNLPGHLADPHNPYYNKYGTQWPDFYEQWANIFNVSAVVRAGNKNAQYKVTFGHYNEDGMILNSGFKKYHLNADVNFTPRSNFLMAFHAGATRTDMKKGRSFGAYNATLGGKYKSSLIPLPESDALEEFYKEAYTENRDINTNNAIDLKGRISYSPWSWLSLNACVGAEHIYGDRQLFATVKNNDGKQSVIGSYTGISKGYFNENSLKLSKKFGGHQFDGILAGGFQKLMWEKTVGKTNTDQNYIRIISKEFFKDTRIEDTWGEAIRYDNTILSWWAGFDYNYKERYFFSASYRKDGSHLIDQADLWATYPSYSGAWLFTNEAPLRNNKILSHGKIRASWGKSGQLMNDYFVGYGEYDPRGIDGYINYRGKGLSFFPDYQKGVPSMDLLSPVTEQKDLGIELGFLNNHLIIEGDYYEKTTNNHLFKKGMSDVGGYAFRWINGGEIENKGYEVTLHLLLGDEKTQFQWQTSLNLAYNENKVVSFPSTYFTYKNKKGEKKVYPEKIINPYPYAVAGRPVSSYYVYHNKGVYSSEDQIPATPYSGRKLTYKDGSEVMVGDPMLEDANGDFVLDEKDRTYMVNPTPDYTGGLHNYFRFGAFEVDLQCTFALGFDIIRKDLAQSLNLAPGFENYSMINYKEHIGKYYNWESFSNPFRNRSIDDDYLMQSNLVEDGSYFRVKSLTLRYDIGHHFPNWEIRDLKLFVTGHNLALFSDYSGNDPATSDPVWGTVNQASYPFARKYVLGLNFNF